MFKNYLKITWKVLKRKKVYTFVTLAGIIIPVTFIVLITSFLVQLNSYESPKSNFKNVMFIDRVKWTQIKEDGKINSTNNNPPTLFFINKYVKTLKSPEAVSVISADPFGDNDIIYQNNKPNEVSIKYTDSELWNIADFKFINGRPFNSSEFDHASRVAVIDKKTANTFFGTTDAIGESLQLKNKAYRVVGIVENVNITMIRLTANIYLPYSCNDNYLSKSQYSNFSTAIILCKNKAGFSKVEQEYQEKLKTVTFENYEGFNHVEGSLTQENYISRLKDISLRFFHFYGDIKKPLYLFGAILFFFFIVLPSVNLINININRVYERLSEIGVRKSFGATRQRLVYQFLFESVLLILAGGILSLIISAIIVYVINQAEIIPGIQLKIHFTAILISLAAVFILGVLSGLMPSMRMARTSIIHSLSNIES
jgi:putative ABC transport system permease protein